jgi:hypothetical protein
MDGILKYFQRIVHSNFKPEKDLNILMITLEASLSFLSKANLFVSNPYPRKLKTHFHPIVVKTSLFIAYLP